MLKNGVYIIECVPKKDEIKEGAMLFEFLRMAIPDRVELKHIKGKNDFFNELNANNSKIIHISCHGNIDDEGNFCMVMPKGNIFPNEFYESDHLKGRNVVITGCFLGRKDFADEFLERTHAESLIAPMKELDFLDSAMWCVNFYYLLLTKGYTFAKGFTYMKENFYVKGAMSMW